MFFFFYASCKQRVAVVAVVAVLADVAVVAVVAVSLSPVDSGTIAQQDFSSLHQHQRQQ